MKLEEKLKEWIAQADTTIQDQTRLVKLEGDKLNQMYGERAAWLETLSFITKSVGSQSDSSGKEPKGGNAQGGESGGVPPTSPPTA